MRDHGRSINTHIASIGNILSVLAHGCGRGDHVAPLVRVGTLRSVCLYSVMPRAGGGLRVSGIPEHVWELGHRVRGSGAERIRISI